MAQSLKVSRRPRPAPGRSVKPSLAAADLAAIPGSRADSGLNCPFCGYESAEYGLLLHMEEAHSEGESPFVAKPEDGIPGIVLESSPEAGQSSSSSNSSSSSPAAVLPNRLSSSFSPAADSSASDSSDGDGDDGSDATRLAECSVKGCIEVLHVSEMAFHLELHSALDNEEAMNGEADVAAPSTEELETMLNVKGEAVLESPADAIRASTRSTSSRAAGGPLASLRPEDAGDKADDQSERHGKRSRHHHHRPHVVDEDSDYERERSRRSHRERREQERSRARHYRDRDRTHNRHRERHHERHRERTVPEAQTAISRKPSTSLRSLLGLWVGVHRKEPVAPVQAAEPPPSSAVSAAADKNKANANANASAAALPPKQRLGKAELGRYAHEERMPDWLAIYLKKEWGVCHQGIIPVLEQLLNQSPTTAYAYLCDPCVQHVSRLPREGGFCGYRNIQTMVSYIVGAQFAGHNLFGEQLPSIFDIQNLIENAWDMGINAHGRIETGGVRLTRKYIGTPEAVAMLTSLNIPCSVRAFNHRKTGRASDLLLEEVEAYFQAGRYDAKRKVRATTLPPIYWQHPGHSLTIVGIEKTKSGRTNLLVFDPIFKDGSPIVRLVSHQRFEHHFPDQLLKLYRRGPRYLDKFKAFEILKLQPRNEDLAPKSESSLSVSRGT